MTRIRLDAIAIDAGTQVRARLDEAVVAEYAERMAAGDAFPPIVVFADGTADTNASPIYFLGDGFHRTMAARRNDLAYLDADVRVGTKSDALWFALGANRANGHQMTQADRRHAIELAILTWGDTKSTTIIADQVGCNQSTVVRIKEQVMHAHNLPGRTTGKDGKSYPASRSAVVSPVGEISPIDEPATAPAFKSRIATQQRRERIRELAADGHSIGQIAAAVGIGEETCRKIVRAHQIDVPADRAVGGLHRHDSNRIVEQMVMDAEHLTADVPLIEFSRLDTARLAVWIESLVQSRRALHGFIQRLLKEQQKHGEAA
jgi:hypothetical protein